MEPSVPGFRGAIFPSESGSTKCQCAVAIERNKDAGTKIESHVHAASVRDWDILRKGKSCCVAEYPGYWQIGCHL